MSGGRKPPTMWVGAADGFIRETVVEGYFEYKPLHMDAMCIVNEAQARVLVECPEHRTLRKFIGRRGYRRYFKPFTPDDDDAAMCRWESKLEISEIGEYTAKKEPGFYEHWDYGEDYHPDKIRHPNRIC